MVETNYELLEILSLCYRERVWPPLIKTSTVITFPGCICFENARKNCHVKSRPRISLWSKFESDQRTEKAKGTSSRCPFLERVCLTET